MNKTMEYMAFELPVVAFDLRETRVSAGEAGVYVTPNDVHDYAAAIVELMDDKARRPGWGSWGASPRRAGAGLEPPASAPISASTGGSLADDSKPRERTGG